MATTAPNLILEVNNIALSEAITYCDFALNYNADDYLITDGFIKKQATPELANYYPGEALNFCINNTNQTNGDQSFFKRITIRNVTKPELFKTNSPESVLKTIFEVKGNWTYQEATETTGEMLFCNHNYNDNCTSCKIDINESFDFYDLSDYYISYTVQYYYKISGQSNAQTCVFDPLIKITNNRR